MKFTRCEKGISHIVGLSGGKDSTAMALALVEREPKPYTFVCTPTGSELPPMIEHWRKLESLLDMKLTVITNGTLTSITRDNKMLPNCHARFCTRILKLVPFSRFVADNSPAIVYVGLRADEGEDAREGMNPGGSVKLPGDIVQDFPLRRWGWTIDDVLCYLDSKGVTVPERTDCDCCPYQRLGEWYNLWANYPDRYAAAEAMEAEFGHTYRSPTGNHGPWPAGLKELRAEFESGRIPQRSLNMMAKRKNMCRTCSM